jgi:hypothetical protein
MIDVSWSSEEGSFTRETAVEASPAVQVLTKK